MRKRVANCMWGGGGLIREEEVVLLKTKTGQLEKRMGLTEEEIWVGST